MATSTVHFDPPKLPVISLVKEAVGHVWSNLRLSFTMQRRWLLLLAPVLLPLNAVTGWLELTMKDSPISNLGVALLAAATSLAALVAVVIYAASISVGWVRFALLDERPSADYRRLDSVVWSYLGYGVLLLLIFLGILAAPTLLGLILSSLGLTAFGGLLGFLIGFAIVARLGLVIVSRAIETNVGLATVWKVTRGNAMRFLGAALLIMLISLVIGLVIALGALLAALPIGILAYAGLSSTTVGTILVVILSAIIQVAVLPLQTSMSLVAVSFSAFAYRFFERR